MLCAGVIDGQGLLCEDERSLRGIACRRRAGEKEARSGGVLDQDAGFGLWYMAPICFLMVAMSGA